MVARKNETDVVPVALWHAAAQIPIATRAQRCQWRCGDAATVRPSPCVISGALDVCTRHLMPLVRTKHTIGVRGSAIERHHIAQPLM